VEKKRNRGGLFIFTGERGRPLLLYAEIGKKKQFLKRKKGEKRGRNLSYNLERRKEG